MDRRERLETSFGAFWFAPAEAVIVHKLLFFREGGSEKHLDDIRAIIASTPAASSADLTHWITRLGLEPEWGKLGKAES